MILLWWLVRFSVGFLVGEGRGRRKIRLFWLSARLRVSFIFEFSLPYNGTFPVRVDPNTFTLMTGNLKFLILNTFKSTNFTT